MESTRPIRALMRGLDALTFLNLRDGATVSEVAQEIRLPRTTVYRILETLCNAGFGLRGPAPNYSACSQRSRYPDTRRPRAPAAWRRKSALACPSCCKTEYWPASRYALPPRPCR